MFVTAIIVTYGNRFNFLKSVLEALEKTSINKAVVILNKVSNTYKENIERFKQLSLDIDFIDQKSNTGSAGGFHIGIKRALDQNTDYLWLLDDDNCPEKDALHNLITHVNKSSFDKNNDALLSFRKDRPQFKEAVIQNNGAKMLKGMNSALGFSLFPNNHLYVNYQEKGLQVAPYGGLFFHKNLIDTIGLPDKSLFLYADDYDFTIRIPKNRGKIRLVPESVIQDLEVSFHLKKQKSITTRFHRTDNLQLIYFSTRNAIIFELKHQATNLIAYFLNLTFYLIIISILLLVSLDIRKIRAFLSGAIDGAKLGIRSRKHENKS